MSVLCRLKKLIEIILDFESIIQSILILIEATKKVFALLKRKPKQADPKKETDTDESNTQQQ